MIAEYPIAALAGAPNPDAAAAFVEFVLVRRRQAILADFGFARLDVTVRQRRRARRPPALLVVLGVSDWPCSSSPCSGCWRECLGPTFPSSSPAMWSRTLCVSPWSRRWRQPRSP